MADRKISQLTALTTPAAGDYLPIVDISEVADADKNKRITIEELLRGAPNGTAAAPGIAFESDGGNGLYLAGTDTVAISTNGTGRLFVDSSGRLLVGTSTARGSLRFQVEGTDINGSAITTTRNSADASPSVIGLKKSRGTTAGSYTAVVANDRVGVLAFYGADGSADIQLAGIDAYVDGTPGANDMPGRLVFSTTADGASSPTERMKIASDGACTISNSSYLQPATDNAVYLGGGTNLRWIAVYAANGTIQTSDARQKTEIATSSLGIDFVKSLRPVSYKFIVGGNKPTGETDADGNWIYQEVPGKRTHWGFIAQEVKEAVDTAGVDFGGWILDDPSNPDSDQGLRYDQFIAPLTKALQEALVKIEILEAKVAALEG